MGQEPTHFPACPHAAPGLLSLEGWLLASTPPQGPSQKLKGPGAVEQCPERVLVKLEAKRRL